MVHGQNWFIAENGSNIPEITLFYDIYQALSYCIEKYSTRYKTIKIIVKEIKIMHKWITMIEYSICQHMSLLSTIVTNFGLIIVGKILGLLA